MFVCEEELESFSTIFHCVSEQQHGERKCADTTGTVLVPWAGHFQR